jgi:hypothetical protein
MNAPSLNHELHEFREAVGERTSSGSCNSWNSWFQPAFDS